MITNFGLDWFYGTSTILFIEIVLFQIIQLRINIFFCFIIIVIMSHYQHGYSQPTLAIPPYRPLLPAGPQGYIPYRHRAAVCRFELIVLRLHVHVKGSTGVHHL